MNYVESFNNTVINRNMKEFWEDTLYELSPQEKLERSRSKYMEAYNDFIFMMNSPKNDNSIKYLTWAINKALGLTSKTHRNIR